jgi:hypothetical protein
MGKRRHAMRAAADGGNEDRKGGWATYGTRTRDIHDHNVALYQLS